MTDVLPLEGAAAASLDQVGGKAAGLARLTALGIAIPPGLVVTGACFRRVVEHCPAYAEYRRAVGDRAPLAVLRPLAAEIRAYLAARPLADELGPEVRATCSTLPGRTLIVRSSAPAEDSAEASCAGLFRSEVTGRGWPEVAEAVRRCWLSAFDERPLAFLVGEVAAGPPATLPLVVQPLVAGAVSGVLFTVDPVTGDRSQVTVEAVSGLGSALVDGRASPVRYALDKVTGALRERAGTPAGTADRVGVDGRVTRQPVGRSAAAESLLGPDQLEDLVVTAARMERELGHPVDVEWTVPESGRAVVYLQVRPLTGLPASRPPARSWLPERVLTGVREGADS